MLKSRFHVTAIQPPTVPHKAGRDNLLDMYLLLNLNSDWHCFFRNSFALDLCRLRVTLSGAHTFDDIKRLVDALSCCIDLSAINVNGMASDVMAKL